MAGDVLLRDVVRRQQAFTYGDKWEPSEMTDDDVGNINTGDTTINVHGANAEAATAAIRAAVAEPEPAKNL